VPASLRTSRVVGASVVTLLLSAPAGAQNATSRHCTVAISAVKLAVTDRQPSARAVYRIGEDCRVTRATPPPDAPAPARAASPAAAGATPRASSEDASLVLGASGAAPVQGPRACTLDVWEEDVAAVPMVTLRNSTAWDTSGGAIVSARVHKVAFPNLDWWFVDGKPSAHVSYVREPYTARTTASGDFYCEGAGPLARYVCSGPSFRVTFRGEILFDGGGVCSGGGTATGSVVPGGRVHFELTRDRQP
jgi:hypothetical protein